MLQFIFNFQFYFSVLCRDCRNKNNINQLKDAFKRWTKFISFQYCYVKISFFPLNFLSLTLSMYIQTDSWLSYRKILPVLRKTRRNICNCCCCYLVIWLWRKENTTRCVSWNWRLNEWFLWLCSIFYRFNFETNKKTKINFYSFLKLYKKYIKLTWMSHKMINTHTS